MNYIMKFLPQILLENKISITKNSKREIKTLKYIEIIITMNKREDKKKKRSWRKHKMW